MKVVKQLCRFHGIHQITSSLDIDILIYLRHIIECSVLAVISIGNPQWKFYLVWMKTFRNTQFCSFQIAFFAILAVALAVPKPSPSVFPAFTTYGAINPIYNNFGYSYGSLDYSPYAPNFYNGYYNNYGYGLYL